MRESLGSSITPLYRVKSASKYVEIEISSSAGFFLSRMNVKNAAARSMNPAILQPVVNFFSCLEVKAKSAAADIPTKMASEAERKYRYSYQNASILCRYNREITECHCIMKFS